MRCTRLPTGLGIFFAAKATSIKKYLNYLNFQLLDFYRENPSCNYGIVGLLNGHLLARPEPEGEGWDGPYLSAKLRPRKREGRALSTSPPPPPPPETQPHSVPSLRGRKGRLRRNPTTYFPLIRRVRKGAICIAILLSCSVVFKILRRVLSVTMFSTR